MNSALLHVQTEMACRSWQAHDNRKQLRNSLSHSSGSVSYISPTRSNNSRCMKTDSMFVVRKHEIAEHLNKALQQWPSRHYNQANSIELFTFYSSQLDKEKRKQFLTNNEVGKEQPSVRVLWAPPQLAVPEIKTWVEAAMQTEAFLHNDSVLGSVCLTATLRTVYYKRTAHLRI